MDGIWDVVFGILEFPFGVLTKCVEYEYNTVSKAHGSAQETSSGVSALWNHCRDLSNRAD